VGENMNRWNDRLECDWRWKIPTHLRKSMNLMKPNGRGCLVFKSALDDMKIKFQSPAWDKNGAIAHISIPKHKVAIYVISTGMIMTRLRQLRDLWEKVGYVMIDIPQKEILEEQSMGTLKETIKEFLGNLKKRK